MTAKKEYRNAIRSRQLLRAAFVDLLHEKNFEKITATDIINRSGLNRSTFYAHYPDVKGITEEFTREILVMFQQMLAEMDFSEFLQNPEPNLKKVMVFLVENQELYRLLGQSEMALSYLDQLKKALIQQVLDTPNLPSQNSIHAEIQIRLMMSGIIDTYRQWLAGEIPCSLEDVASAVAEAIHTRSSRP